MEVFQAFGTLYVLDASLFEHYSAYMKVACMQTLRGSDMCIIEAVRLTGCGMDST